MRGYLLRKVGVQREAVAWARLCIQNLVSQGTLHAELCEKLLERVDEAERALDRLKAIAAENDPVLNKAARPLLHRVEWIVHILNCRFLPALRRELDEDETMRRILLRAVSDSSMTWVRDVAVRLDGPHASFPVIPGNPLFYGPSNQIETLVGMPAFFHEFGHSLFEATQANTALRDVVTSHFRSLAERAGPQSPEVRASREQAINEAMGYWSRPRLNELFSDVFAVYSCGPAYLATCVDLGLASKRNPYQIAEEDVHPPWAARVSVCYSAVHAVHRDSSIVEEVMSTWGEHTAGNRPPAKFELACSDELIQLSAARALQYIGEEAPGCRRYDEVVGPLAEIPSELGRTLPTILNQALSVLVTDPEHFRGIEKIALQRLLVARG